MKLLTTLCILSSLLLLPSKGHSEEWKGMVIYSDTMVLELKEGEEERLFTHRETTSKLYPLGSWVRVIWTQEGEMRVIDSVHTGQSSKDEKGESSDR